MDENSAKKIIGITALTAGAYLALRGKDNKEEGFNTGNFGGLGGNESSSFESGEKTGEGISPVNINFPSIEPLPIFRDNNSPNTQTQTDIVEEISDSKQPKTTTKKESLINSSTSLLSETYDRATKAVTIEPSTLKAGSTKRAIEARSEKGQPWSLSDNSITNLKSYVGTPGNVVNEQIKKVKEAIGTNQISQKGNTISEYTAEEKAKSKTEMTIFEKVFGKTISPAYEEPRIVTAGKNIVSPVVEKITKNITKNPTAWSRQEVDTTSKEANSLSSSSLTTTKKEATSLAQARINNAKDEAYLASKSSSARSSGSSGSSKATTTSTKKKVISLKQAKTVRND